VKEEVTELRSRILAAVLAFTLLAALAPGALGIAASPPLESDLRQGTPLSNELIEPTEGRSPQPGEPETYEVRLITGDLVVVSVWPDGRKGIAIQPADPEAKGSFLVVEQPAHSGFFRADSSLSEETDTYVLPDGVDFTRLDMELFNVDYLIQHGYCDLPYLPVLVSSKGLAGMRGLDVIENGIATVAESFDAYPWLSTVAVQLLPGTLSDAYQTLTELDAVEKIWLDRMVYPSLHESVPHIGAPDVWDSGYTGNGVTIAILDTGIDATHPDLDDLDDDPVTNDPKVLYEVNFTDDPTAEDGYGHGTHCASIAAGTGGGRTEAPFHVGVALGAWLYNVKVLGEQGYGLNSWIIDGIEFAVLGPDGIADTGDEADVISMSLGGSPTDGTDPLSEAVNWAVAQGAVVVVSAGNSGDYFTIGAPGAAQDVITVGASTKSDTIASFSSRGPVLGTDFGVKPDVLAPGVAIIAARAGGTSMGSPVDDLYTSAQGTSMAAPHVSGAAALVLQANPAVPLGWSAPRFVKNSLMSSALDLGYDAYTQGAGRIDVPAATDPLILVDPATASFGNYSTDAVVSQEFTFYNLDATSHDLDLSTALTQVFSAEDHSGNVTLTPAVLTVPAGGSATATLQVSTTGLPEWLYGGRITATIDGGPVAVSAIFGLARLAEFIVEKVDVTGDPGEDHYVAVFNDQDQLWFRQGWTDTSGRVTFYVPSDEYQVVTLSSDRVRDASVWNFGTTTVAGTGSISLDDTSTVPVDFDPNKPGQVVAEKNSQVYFPGQNYTPWFYSIWRYPTTNLTYVAPTTSWDTGYTYGYYPQEYRDYSDSSVLDTPEWARLRYDLDAVTGPTTFVADYSNLVTRTTLYRTPLEQDEAGRIQWAVGPVGSDLAFWWRMRAPRLITETLSPAPVRYPESYRDYDPQGQWHFNAPWPSYPPGEALPYAYGGHPFNSDAWMNVSGGQLSLGGYISTDAKGNAFYNYTRSPGGHLTVEQDGATVLDQDIGDYFYEEIGYVGTPATVVTIDGWSGQPLSTETHTVLSFVADPTIDHTPPYFVVGVVEPTGLDLYNAVAPTGDIQVGVFASDTESGVADVGLSFSLDDGIT